MKKRWWFIICLFLLSLAMMVSEASIPWPKEKVILITAKSGDIQTGHIPGNVYQILDRQGKFISRTSFPVSKGDYLIDEKNRGYTIREVHGRRAVADYDGPVNLLGAGQAILQARGPVGPICIYHSHSDESYVPDSGRPTENIGDIYKVGEMLANVLRKKGYKVIHSYANHNPHDAASYIRSRRTVAQLLKSKPSMLIDVHRDAIPDADYYRKHFDARQVAGLRIVVGKQNSNRSVNFDFAKALKAKADEKYPGLVREIFWARGNYNQDVAPRTILCEFGTHTNSLQEVQRGVALMADVVGDILGAAGGAGSGTPSMNRSGWWTLGWILLLVLGGAGIFLALNSDSWRKVKSMVSKEMTGSLGTEDEPEPEKNEKQE